MEGNTKSISDHLKYVAAMGFRGSAQNLVVARHEGRKVVRILLGEPCAALDIGEQEGDSARWMGFSAWHGGWLL